MTNLSLVAVNQYGVMTTVKKKLQRCCHILRRDRHKWIFIGGDRNLKMLDTVLLHKVGILWGGVFGNKSPSLY